MTVAKKKKKEVKHEEEVPPIPDKFFPALIWFASFHTGKAILTFLFVGIIIWALTTVSITFKRTYDGKFRINKIKVEKVDVKNSVKSSVKK